MGLYDRDYMKDDAGGQPPHRPSFWSALFGALVLASILAYVILKNR